MDERTKMLILFDIYGELLTEKQKTIMDYYYNDDLSLTEIGENGKISRQAIHDTIKRCEKLLISYEDKLGVLQKNMQIKKTKAEISKMLHSLECNDNLEVINSIISKLDEIN
ncbi:hypothetical protein SAMN02745248_00083 [Hathewaya proteolytica DSM 3090]|uniref:UPF0122 protein SAMN02745248_00083 n=1 Tax=Hathewaya proteolytica DSM 3090 TaxID=1121331 RepID=A0A1M6J893_9CLOT|nr:putative DNA-binding protein [Hathewaya proteolytica]SHJ42906.1 hypothetical protein SAMN02745248_00083 [Hathewaya proteolytica DSM 3090]